ncbi:MAG: AbrB/MazE/SpoVT family DNA-binding domain-containing protein [Anaerovoracaceae bacterium]
MKRNRLAGTATVGEKGQIVIPKAIRDMFGIEPGDTLMILADSRKGIAIPPQEKFDELYKLLGEDVERD